MVRHTPVARSFLSTECRVAWSRSTVLWVISRSMSPGTTPVSCTTRANISGKRASCMLRAEMLTATRRCLALPVPRGALGQGMAKDPLGDGPDELGLLGQADELVGIEHPGDRVAPPDQRLDADYAARRQVDLRLVLEEELVRRQGLGDVGQQADPSDPMRARTGLEHGHALVRRTWPSTWSRPPAAGASRRRRRGRAGRPHRSWPIPAPGSPGPRTARRTWPAPARLRPPPRPRCRCREGPGRTRRRRGGPAGPTTGRRCSSGRPRPRRTSSPTSWPRRSLIDLKPFRSMSTTATRWPVRRADRTARSEVLLEQPPVGQLREHVVGGLVAAHPGELGRAVDGPDRHQHQGDQHYAALADHDEDGRKDRAARRRSRG